MEWIAEDDKEFTPTPMQHWKLFDEDSKELFVEE